MSRGSEDYKQEVLSNVSDLSLDKFDEVITQLSKIQSSGGDASADYTDTTNNKAYKDDWPEFPPTTAPRETGTELTAGEYLTILTANNAGISKGSDITTYGANIFRIKKPAAAVGANPFTITFRGAADTWLAGTTKLHAYIYDDNSSAWEEFDEVIVAGEGWKTITKTISEGTDYINGSDYIYVLVLIDQLGTAGPPPPPNRLVRTDYISLSFGVGHYNRVQINSTVTDTDDANIAHAQTTLVVINLNYVHDGAKWIRMTQP